MREQKTSERATADDAYARPFDLFVEQMADVVQRLGVRASAPKDKWSVSPFLRLISATLQRYGDALETLDSDWQAEYRAKCAAPDWVDDEFDLSPTDKDVENLLGEEFVHKRNSR